MTFLFENKVVKTSRLTLTLTFILSTGNPGEPGSGLVPPLAATGFPGGPGASGSAGFPGGVGAHGSSEAMDHTGTRYMQP